MLNDILPRFRLDKDFSNMSYTQLITTTRGYAAVIQHSYPTL